MSSDPNTFFPTPRPGETAVPPSLPVTEETPPPPAPFSIASLKPLLNPVQTVDTPPASTTVEPPRSPNAQNEATDDRGNNADWNISSAGTSVVAPGDLGIVESSAIHSGSAPRAAPEAPTRPTLPVQPPLPPAETTAVPSGTASPSPPPPARDQSPLPRDHPPPPSPPPPKDEEVSLPANVVIPPAVSTPTVITTEDEITKADSIVPPSEPERTSVRAVNQLLGPTASVTETIEAVRPASPIAPPTPVETAGTAVEPPAAPSPAPIPPSQAASLTVPDPIAQSSAPAVDESMDVDAVGEDDIPPESELEASASTGGLKRAAGDDLEGRDEKRIKEESGAQPRLVSEPTPIVPQTLPATPAGNGSAPLPWQAYVPPPPRPAGPTTPLTPTQHKHLTASLRSIKKNKEAINFLEPVDVVRFGIPHYAQIITKPMDIGTVEQKLLVSDPRGPPKDKSKMSKWDTSKGSYGSVSEMVQDMRQVWENTRNFNGPEHVVSQAAKKLDDSFEKMLKNMPPEVSVFIKDGFVSS